jgi:hypothetical protein
MKKENKPITEVIHAKHIFAQEELLDLSRELGRTCTAINTLEQEKSADALVNPNRLTVFTNHPDESLNPDPKVWTLSHMLVMRFYPGMQESLIDRKLYAIRFWRPEPEKQPNLL